MKIILLEVITFEQGDRVFTPEGEGTVTEDEPIFTDMRMRPDIKVRLDNPTSRNPNCDALIPWDCVGVISI
jgi:hypothetical protein